MEISRKPLELYDVLWASDMARSHINTAAEMVNDTKKDARIKAQECQSCFYSGKIGGSALTYTLCGLCQDEVVSGNTCIDRICLECAIERRLCKHCGGDINMKNRRKL